MIMHNPPHPGEFISDTYLEPFGYSCRFMATQLAVQQKAGWRCRIIIIFGLHAKT